MPITGFYTYQAPTGILTGPLEDNKSRFTQPATVLMKLYMSAEYRYRSEPLTSPGEYPSAHPSPLASP